MVIAGLGFRAWMRVTHWINVLFLGLLARASAQILGAYPRLYWNGHSTPGTEWLMFMRKRIHPRRLWIMLVGQGGTSHERWLVERGMEYA